MLEIFPMKLIKNLLNNYYQGQVRLIKLLWELMIKDKDVVFVLLSISTMKKHKDQSNINLKKIKFKDKYRR